MQTSFSKNKTKHSSLCLLLPGFILFYLTNQSTYIYIFCICTCICVQDVPDLFGFFSSFSSKSHFRIDVLVSFHSLLLHSFIYLLFSILEFVIISLKKKYLSSTSIDSIFLSLIEKKNTKKKKIQLASRTDVDQISSLY